MDKKYGSILNRFIVFTYDTPLTSAVFNKYENRTFNFNGLRWYLQKYTFQNLQLFKTLSTHSHISRNPSITPFTYIFDKLRLRRECNVDLKFAPNLHPKKSSAKLQ